MLAEVLISPPLTLALSAFSMAATGAAAIFRRREKRRSCELSAARKIIDKITHEQWLVLSEASKTLPVSLDYREALRRMVEIAVPSLACCCTVDLIEEDQNWLRIRARVSTLPTQVTEETLSPPHDPSHPLLRALDGEAQVYSAEDMPEALRESLLGASSGSQLPVLTGAMVVPMSSSQGPIGVIAFGLTAPGRRYAGFDLDLARQLAARAALAVDNSRLYKQTQSAVQARDRLLAVVSHELKNPLTAIALHTQYLLRCEKDPKLASQVEAIQFSAQRMQGIINDLLDLDQIEGGRFAMKLAPEDPAQLVSDSIRMMQPMASNKGVILSSELAGANEQVHADRLRISQVISNLVGNAIKFTPSGGRVIVRLHFEGQQAVVSVIDNGPGMAPEQLPRAFDRYWQDGKTAHLGSGLGLSVSKGLVDLHGGEIGIESTLGQGTTVRFSLPLLHPTTH